MALRRHRRLHRWRGWLVAVIANLFAEDKRRLTVISWATGALASIIGLWLSYTKDLPTGPLIVCMYGLLLVLAVGARRLAKQTA